MQKNSAQNNFEQKDEPQIIETIDEEGKSVKLKLVEVVTVNDKDYALLSLLNDSVEGENTVNCEDEELVLMRMTVDGDECQFEVIEDDEEFNFVTEALNEEGDEDEE